MERSFDEICEQIKRYKLLTPEKREQELKSLEERVEALSNEVLLNSKAIEEARKKLEKAKLRAGDIKKDYADIRNRRQAAITFEKDTKELTASIKKLKDEEEMLEDTCIGLERKVENLVDEENLLKEEGAEAEKMILRFKMIPLVQDWNKLMEAAARIIGRQWDLEIKLNDPPHRRTITFSEGIEILPKAYLMGDEGPADRQQGRLRHVFDYREFKREKVREMQAKIYNKQG